MLDLVGGQRRKRLGARPAGIVDQDVGDAVFLEDRWYRRFDGSPVEQVEDVARRQMRAAELTFRLVAADDPCAALRQKRHDGRAEAAAGAGDQHSLTCKFGL